MQQQTKSRKSKALCSHNDCIVYMMCAYFFCLFASSLQGAAAKRKPLKTTAELLGAVKAVKKAKKEAVKTEAVKNAKKEAAKKEAVKTETTQEEVNCERPGLSS